MALLDFSHFGISADDINNGAYKYVIGFDLGDGELSAAYAPIGGAEPSLPTDLFFSSIGRKIMSAIFFDAANEPHIGSMEMLNGFNAASGKLYQNFKATPARLEAGELYEGSQVRKLWLMQKLLELSLEMIYKSVNDKTCFAGRGILAIGCPSSDEWTRPQTLQMYANMLQEALTFPKVKALNLNLKVVIIPESRASILKVYQEKSAEISERIRRGAIVIDHGSSTLDVSMIDFDNNTQLDRSIPLGASKIERQALAIAVSDHQRRLNEVEEPEFHYVALRTAKESHFSNAGARSRVNLEFTDGNIVRQYIDSEFMNRVTHENDVKYSTENIPVKKGPWAGLHREFLEGCREEFKKLQGRDFDGVVMLTGGASRMGFTRENAKDVFPLAQIELDAEASYCVSRGLVRAIITDFKAISLIDKVKNRLRNEVRQGFTSLKAEIALAVTPLVFDYVADRLDEWSKPAGANIPVRTLAESISREMLDSSTPDGCKRADRFHSLVSDAVGKYLNRDGSGSLRQQIVRAVNDIFSSTFPGSLGENAVRFTISNEQWLAVAKSVTTGKFDITETVINSLDICGLLLDIIFVLLAFILWACTLFIGNLDTIYEGLRGENRTMSDSKRKNIATNFRSKRTDNENRLRDRIAQGISDETREIYVGNISTALAPIIDRAVDNVSLYF